MFSWCCIPSYDVKDLFRILIIMILKLFPIMRLKSGDIILVESNASVIAYSFSPIIEITHLQDFSLEKLST